MQKEEYKNIYENESSHFFYVGNHEIIISLVRNLVMPKVGKMKILDAGCGTGFLAKRLEEFGKVQGVDISKDAIKFSKRRGVNVTKASINNLPFKNSSFELVTSIDVIYHKQVDDKRALREFFRVLKPGAFLILRVPANKWLTSSHDKYVDTRQRYSREELKKKLLASGFILKKISYVNMCLLPLAAIKSFFEKFQPKPPQSSVIQPIPFVNKLLTLLLILEAKILKITSLPFGQGLVAVCQKPPLSNKISSRKK